MVRRLLSSLISLCLVMTLIPATAFAAEGNPTSSNAITVSDESALTAAVATAADNTETIITLGENIQLTNTLTIPAAKSIVLDLNNCAVTVPPAVDGRSLYAINNDGTLIIRDTSTDGNGSISSRGIQNNGTMTLESGTVKCIDSNGGGAAIWNEGTFYMTGGKAVFTGEKLGDSAGSPFTNTNAGIAEITGGELISPYTCIFAQQNSKLTVKNISLTSSTDFWMTIKVLNNANATFENVTVNTTNGGCFENAGGTVTLKNCTFTQTVQGNPAWNSCAVATSNGAQTIVEGGSYTGTVAAAYIYTSGGTITIEDGTFTGDTVSLKADTSNKFFDSNIIVRGGTFQGGYSIGATRASLSISGGTFSHNPTDYITEAEFVQRGDQWIVGTLEDLAIAEVIPASGGASTKYITLENALDAAENGDTIQILKDVTLDQTINVKKALTFEGATQEDGSKPIISCENGIFSQSGAAVYTLKNLELQASKNGQWYIYHSAGVMTIENCDFTMASGVTYTGNVVMGEGAGDTKSLVFKNNTITANSRAALVGIGNGSMITGNTIDLLGEKYNDTTSRTSILSVTAVDGENAQGVIITNNTFKNANRGIAVDNSTLYGSKITIENNTFDQVRFAFELSPSKNKDCGSYDLSRNTYTFTENDVTITELKIQNADSEGDKFSFGDESSEYKPQEGDPEVSVSISVSLNQSNVTLYSNTTPNTVQLTATVTTNSTNKTVTWASSDTNVATVSDTGLVTAVGNGTAVITAKAGPAEATCTVTVSTYSAPSGGGGSSSGNKTETVTNPDGSTTTTVTKPDGSTTETTKYPDGSKEVVDTKKDGTVTTTTTDKAGNETKVVENTDGSSKTTITNKNGSSSTTTVSKDGTVESQVELSTSVVNNAATSGETITLPIPQVPATSDKEAAPTVTVDLPADTDVVVEIPVENVTAGTVAVRMLPDGSQEVIMDSVTTENGVIVTLHDGDTVKVLDNSVDFVDVPDSHWASDAVDFATSRELFNGTSATTFSPAGDMTRAMVLTVLARYEGVDTTTGDTWYEAGMAWAVENGISDGTNPMGAVTREQLALMLYRYSDASKTDGTLSGFADASSVSDWAFDAMVWAVENGLINGVNGNLNPQGTASRAEVAAMFMRFITYQNK